MQKQNLQNHFCLTTFILLTLWGVLHHEMWTDEARTWVMARDFSFFEMIPWLRNEAHAVLWPWMVKALSFVIPNPLGMQLFSWAIGCCAFALLVYRSPLPMWFKWLLALNYYLVFEYTIISRSYALELLFLFGACFYYDRRFQQPFHFWLCVCLLPITHAFGGFISLGFFVAALADLKSWLKTSSQTKILLLALFASSAGLLYFSYHRGHEDVGLMWNDWIQPLRWSETLSIFFNSVVLIFKPTLHFWIETPRQWPISLQPLFACGFAVLFIGMCVLFFQWRDLFLFFGISSLGLIIFRHVLYADQLRHLGQLTLIWVAALWMLSLRNKNVLSIGRWRSILLTLLGGVQAYSLCIALYFDTQYLFSEGERAAQYLSQFSQSDYELWPREMFQSSVYQAHLPWPYVNRPQDKKSTLTEFRFMTQDLSLPGTDSAQKKYVIVTTRPLEIEWLKANKYVLAQTFDTSIVVSNHFYVYTPSQ